MPRSLLLSVVAALLLLPATASSDQDQPADTRPPIVSFANLPNSATEGDTVTWQIDTDEPASLACSFDDAPPTPCGSPYVLNAAPRGIHKLAVTGTDAAGNVSAPRTASIFVKARPVTTDPPALVARLDVRQSVRRPSLLRFGAKVDVVCSRACEVTARLKRGSTVLATATRAHPSSAPLKLKLGRSAQKQLSKARVSWLKLVIEVRGPGGERVTQSRPIKVNR